MRTMDQGSDSLTGYVYQDALDLPATDDLFSEPDAWADVLVEPPRAVRSFVRPMPEFLSDPDNVGLFSGLSPDVFFSPPAFVARAQKARIVGFRTVLSNDGRFFNDDSIAGEEKQREFLRTLSMPDPLNEETGLGRAKGEVAFKLDLKGRQIQRIPGTTIHLSSAEPSNYGSWLFRVLPKVEMIKRFSLDRNASFLVWAGLPSFREYLQILEVPENRIIEHDPKNVVYQLDRAIVPSIRNNQAFIDGESLSLFERMRNKFGERREAGKRVYVSRLSRSNLGSPRTMQNEAELIERLKGMAFQIVNPETLSVPEQIRVFSFASMVVGPSGSGMFNVVFCHPETKIIDIESEPHWIHAHICLFASCGHRFGIFVGKATDNDFRTHHKPWNVNIDVLVERIKAFSLT